LQRATALTRCWIEEDDGNEAKVGLTGQTYLNMAASIACDPVSGKLTAPPLCHPQNSLSASNAALKRPFGACRVPHTHHPSPEFPVRDAGVQSRGDSCAHQLAYVDPGRRAPEAERRDRERWAAFPTRIWNRWAFCQPVPFYGIIRTRIMQKPTAANSPWAEMMKENGRGGTRTHDLTDVNRAL
jgi:hypothetical protein